MINKCKKNDESKVITYIGNDYPLCLYLYLDLLKYGTESNSVEVYTQILDNEIKAVLLKYYSCLHIYSRDKDYNDKELAIFLSDNNFTMLYCTVEIAKRIYSALPQAKKNCATVTEGWVAQIKRVDHEPHGLSKAAEEKDFKQIVKLIYEDDDIGRSYKLEELSKQLEERNRQGYARNIVIKQGDQVIAHACTNAELNGIAVVAELLVKEEYRKKGFASEIWRALCSQLLSEGKEVYSFYYSDESRMLHKHIGFFEVCEWAKVIIS